MRKHQWEYESIKSILSEIPRLGYFQDKFDLLFDFCNYHKLFSLSVENIVNSFDLSQREKWQQVNQKLTMLSLHLSSALEKIIARLNSESIRVIAIKGPVLSQTLFNDLGKRHFGDLDLIVTRFDFHRVIDILSSLGYEMIIPKTDLSYKQWEYYFKYKKDVILVNREKGVVLELHLGIYRHELLRKLDEEIFFKDLDIVAIGYTPIKTLNKDNTFLYLLYHGGQHLYFKLFWLRDIAEALKKWDLNHAEILQRAQQMGIERMVGCGLLLANEFFGTKIPVEYEYYIQNNYQILSKLEQICINTIKGSKQNTLGMKLRRQKFNLMLKKDIKYKQAVISSIFHRWYIRKFLGGN